MPFTAKLIISEDFLDRAVPWLVIASLALLPVGRTAELPLSLLAIVGLKVVFARFRGGNWEQSTVYFLLFFLCLWIPILISLPDSSRFSKTLSCLLEYPRFLLSGFAVLHYCAKREKIQLIHRCTLGIVVFWIVDALIQYFWGRNLFGYAYYPQRLNGVFGDTLYLGPFLALYSAFVITTLWGKKHMAASALMNMLCLLVMLLAGSRAGWISYLAVLLLFLLYICRNNLKMFILGIGVLSVFAMAAATIVYHYSETFAQRIDTTLLIFEGDEESMDQALSFRLPIWKAAVSMIGDHPVNGVGGRAFRYIYPEYAEENDLFLGQDDTDPNLRIGALHAHQMLLEVLSETGFLGGCFFLGAMTVLVCYWRSRSGFQKSLMLPYGLAIAAIFFPLNTHLSLYSSVFSQVIYWFTSLFFAIGAVSDSAAMRQSS